MEIPIRTAADAHKALTAYAGWVGSLPDPAGCPSYRNPYWHGGAQPMHVHMPEPSVPVEHDPPLLGDGQPRDQPPFDWVLSSLQKWNEPGALVYVQGIDGVPQRVTTIRPWAAVERRNRVGKWLLTSSGPYGVRITDPLQQLVDWVADLDRLAACAARCTSCARSAGAAGNAAAGSALDREADQLDAFRTDRESSLLPIVVGAFVGWWADLRAAQAASERSRPAYRAATLR